MTSAQTRAHGFGTPSLTQLWLGAMLRVFVELVLVVVRLFGMRPAGLSGECHTDVARRVLPQGENGTIKEAKRRNANRHTRSSAYALAASTESFSGLSRESWFDHHGNSQQSRTRTSQDPRHKAEDDVRDVGQHTSHTGIVIPKRRRRYPGTTPQRSSHSFRGSRLSASLRPG